MSGGVTRREFEVMRNYLETLEARVAELEAKTPPEPWLDYNEVAAHYSCGKRTVEKWKALGAPFELREGKQKAQLSKLQRWREVDIGERMNQPNTDANGAAPRTRPAPDTTIGGRDVQAA